MIGGGMRRMHRLRLLACVLLVLNSATGCARPSMNNDAFSNPELAPLADAVRRGDAPEIRRHLERVPADTLGGNGETLLVEAIHRRKPASVEALLEGGADPNRVNARGETPVHVAAFEGDPEALRALLARGGDPDVQNPRTGETPLMRALLSPNRTQYEVLLDAGADPNLADKNGGTALHAAASTNNGAAILRLLEKGARPQAKNSGGATFQDAYFGYRRELLNERGREERRQIIAWLKAHGVPLEAKVEAEY
jgi:uncharacterized protein